MGILSWAEDREMCQATASPRSVKRCPIVASWCIILGQLGHFHTCAEHGIALLEQHRPCFRVRRIEECPMATGPARGGHGEGRRLK